MRSRKIQAIIYVSGTEDERAIQLKWCHEMCERQRWHVYGVARDNGDGSGLIDAQILKRSGIVQKIVVYSDDLIPRPEVESAIDDLPAGRSSYTRPARYVRIRPVKRSGGAGA